MISIRISRRIAPYSYMCTHYISGCTVTQLKSAQTEIKPPSTCFPPTPDTLSASQYWLLTISITYNLTESLNLTRSPNSDSIQDQKHDFHGCTCNTLSTYAAVMVRHLTILWGKHAQRMHVPDPSTTLHCYEHMLGYWLLESWDKGLARNDMNAQLMNSDTKHHPTWHRRSM